jgi:hypothetical protein
MVNGLRERVARFVGLAFRPQQREQFVASEASFARHGEDAKNGEQASLSSGSAEKLAVVGKIDTSKRAQTYRHGAGAGTSDFCLTVHLYK